MLGIEFRILKKKLYSINSFARFHKTKHLYNSVHTLYTCGWAGAHTHLKAYPGSIVTMPLKFHFIWNYGISFKVITQCCTALCAVQDTHKNNVIGRISASALFQCIPRTRCCFSINGPGKEVWWSFTLKRARWPLFLLHNFG